MSTEQGNPNKPHGAVITISANVFDVLDNGHYSGMIRHKVEPFFLQIKGQDRHLAIRKLNDILEEIKKLCPNT